MKEYNPGAVDNYFYTCDMCEINDGRPSIVFKSLPKRKGHFAICLSCLSSLYIQYLSPIDKADEKIFIKRHTISERQRNNIFKRDKYKCVKCGNSKNLTIDHIIPFCRGGKTENKNLQTLCQKCNSKKGAKIE